MVYGFWGEKTHFEDNYYYQNIHFQLLRADGKTGEGGKIRKCSKV